MNHVMVHQRFSEFERLYIVFFVYKVANQIDSGECVRKTSCREEKRERTFLLIETRSNQLLMRYGLCGPLSISAPVCAWTAAELRDLRLLHIRSDPISVSQRILQFMENTRAACNQQIPFFPTWPQEYTDVYHSNLDLRRANFMAV